jgi:HAD superfamily hydrolase (TIGR01549 family)
MEYKAVLFDFEGTLVDFQWKMGVAVEEAQEALSNFGFGTDSFSGCDYAALFNKAMEESQRLGLPVERVGDQINKIYDRFDMDALSRWTPRSDVPHIFEDFINRGILIGLVTNAGLKAVSLFLRRFNFDGMLNIVITRDSVRKLKPEGEGLQMALDALNVEKRQALFVGDSITDILASRMVGVDIAVILGGESNREEIEVYKPDFIIGTLTEILRI